jgi:hypothetical protein
MVNKDIINSLKGNLKRGLSIEEIRQQLLLHNYSDYDIDLAIKELLSNNSKNEIRNNLPHNGNGKYWLFLFIFITIIILVTLFFFNLDSLKIQKHHVSISDFNISKGVLLDLPGNSEINFNLEETNYVLRILFSEEKSQLKVNNLSFYLDLYSGETFDLNEDLEKDLLIEYKNISEGKHSIYLQLINKINCSENWECTDWGICINEKNKRVCIDSNSCGSIDEKPITEKYCNESLENQNNSSNQNALEFINCGESILNEIPLSSFEGFEYSDYDQDNSLLCFGQNLLNTINLSEIKITDEDNSIQKMTILSKNDNSCTIKMEIITPAEGLEDLNGTYLECSFSMEEINSYSCIFDEEGTCLIDNLPGQTTINILSMMIYDAFFNSETTCSGTFLDAL